jgi:hypothetical protein
VISIQIHAAGKASFVPAASVIIVQFALKSFTLPINKANKTILRAQKQEHHEYRGSKSFVLATKCQI